MMEQVATQEQRALDTMQRRETAIANRLAETDKLMKSLQTGLDTTRPDAFLQVQYSRLTSAWPCRSLGKEATASV